MIGGVFNGEGRNQVQNINQSYFYVGRLEVTPLGKVPYEGVDVRRQLRDCRSRLRTATTS